MKSIWQDATRQEMRRRLAGLTQDQAGLWGQMTAPQMIVHVADSLRSCLGDLAVKPKNVPLRYPPLKQLVIYWLPFPKNAPTAPELIARKPGAWATDLADLGALIDRFAARDPAGPWPVHAAFGRLNGTQWGVLMYRHADHHFRQFGA